MDDVLAGFMGQAGAHVVTQPNVAEHAVLEKVVVLDVGVVERDHAVEVAVLPAQVVAQHGVGGERGLLGAVGEGGGGHELDSALQNTQLQGCRSGILHGFAKRLGQ
ncbi:hypothetical protein D3C76_1503420 [compost metagenome]